MSTLTKHKDERVIVQIQADGPLGAIVVDARGDGRVRACFERPLTRASAVAVDYMRPSVQHAVGTNGSLVVTRDLGLERRYQGNVELISGEIDEDLQHYLDVSEQLPSALACAVVLDGAGEVLRAGGVLCQTFPGGDPAEIERIRDRIGQGALHSVLLQERSAAELARFAMGDMEFETTGHTALRYHCPCSPQTAENILSTLGAADLEDLANEQPTTTVTCHFCAESYTLSAAQVRAIAQRLREEVS